MMVRTVDAGRVLVHARPQGLAFRDMRSEGAGKSVLKHT